jgi:hypothetical protein
MTLESKQADRKKTYEPPQLATISLRPEEAVLGACKTFNGGSGFLSTCNAVPFCQNFGS